ncbi:uncharacterized protein LOC123866265 [Maniola jurtina]|uniref:uncharacterized protein LOC123866265 n=1 Tax=Maniola jurtina TaxID=191418 RepID=UPI001E68D78F|nr:uncharacterized protein LOC123866265 [Maniola jurtina]
MKEDLKNVLQASVQKQWDEVRRAMSAFTYFEGLDEVARREGCTVAKMKSYETNETLLGDGVGVPNFVYFTLSGRCQMIESLQVIVTTRFGKKSFTLYDPYVLKEESDQDLDAKYFGAYKNLNKEECDTDATVVNEEDQVESLSKRGSLKRDNGQRVENEGGTEKLSKGSVDFEIPEEAKSEELLTSTSHSNRDHVRIIADAISEDVSVMPIQNLRTYFMQVCKFDPGSSFGFGENMRDRRIVALTPVSCMLLPKIWLLQRNTANIWTRIQHYLEKKIPNKRQLFKEFVSARRWQEFKESLVEDVVSRSNTVNWTTAHDVPYSIRMDEMVFIIDDPEEQMKRKFRAKCLFRALGRLVMANAYWLIEGIDQYEGTDDVKRRVEQAVRGKAKKKQLLSIKDKALLNKNAAERTEQEKRYIFRIIGGLKCFKRYPNHVKKKLAAATYFKYYGPGRVIVRQHQEAHAMYFIISGDVTVSQLTFDELIQQHVSVDVGVMHPGDMFGEVSLLHNIPRTATVTTNDHCELLALMKEDFKNILQASIQKQWDEVRYAMSAFTYFEALDEVALREGCIVAKMKTYGINETLLGDGMGVANFVYFVLSGRCQMIESLQVIVTTRLGKKYYALHDPYVPKVESEQDFDTKYFGTYKHLSKEERESGVTIKSDKERAENSSKYESVSLKRGSLKRASGPRESGGEIETSISKASVNFDLQGEAKSKEFVKFSEFFKEQRESVRISVFPEETGAGESMPLKNIQTYFMQVCQFNPGSSFGFGENMRDRRIVALTPVSCMLLPKIWLLQRNTANIWSRIQHYLEKKIPTKKQLFKEFVSARRWQEFREELVEDVVSHSSAVNYTTVHDVPYSIRMEEMVDI